jgi:hypothetical protein
MIIKSLHQEPAKDDGIQLNRVAQYKNGVAVCLMAHRPLILVPIELRGCHANGM